jgi:hypothetical protein
LLSLLLFLFGRQQRARFALAGALTLALIGRLPSARLPLSSSVSLAFELPPSLDGAFIFDAAGMDHVVDPACSTGLF